MLCDSHCISENTTVCRPMPHHQHPTLHQRFPRIPTRLCKQHSCTLPVRKRDSLLGKEPRGQIRQNQRPQLVDAQDLA
jgi:hypothetical protein